MSDAMWLALEEKAALVGTLKSYIKWSYRALDIRLGAFIDSSPIRGVDGWLYHQFTKAQKPIFGLERMEDTSELCTKLDSRMKIEALLKPNLVNAEDIATDVCDTWRKGDMFEISHNQEGYLDYEISEKRSDKFGNVIYEDIKLNETTEKVGIYGPGAGHLYDDKGIIQSLEARNLKVIRIC